MVNTSSKATVRTEGCEGMLRNLRMLRTLRRDEQGVTALEYGLIAALIGMVILTAVSALGSNLSSVFANAATLLRKAGS